MSDLDFNAARIEVQHTQSRDVFMRWSATLVVPFRGDHIGVVESAHFAMTRGRALRKARRSCARMRRREISYEVVDP